MIKTAFTVLFNLLGPILLFWLAGKAYHELIARLKTREKTDKIPTGVSPAFICRIKEHPIMMDVVNAIRRNTYPYPYSICVEPDGITVELWKERKSFRFSSYGNYGLQSAAQLRACAAALIGKIPNSNYYRLLDIKVTKDHPENEKFVVSSHHDPDSSFYDSYVILTSVVIRPIKPIPTPSIPRPTPSSKYKYL